MGLSWPGKKMIGNTFWINGGAHKGQTCLVLEIPTLYPTFAKVAMLDKNGQKTKLVDLVPQAYLSAVTGGQSLHASKPISNG